MENIATPSILDKKAYGYNSNHKLTFTLPFSERNVLELQEIFISCGVHTIITKNIIDGRKIIQTILQSLNYHSNIGCITHASELPTNVYDIVSHIALQISDQTDFLENLENFFTIHPCFDFVWIELTEHITNQYSLNDLKKIFDMYHAEERMSVLIVMYEE